jgi:hypothetical protein
MRLADVPGRQNALEAAVICRIPRNLGKYDGRGYSLRKIDGGVVGVEVEKSMIRLHPDIKVELK